MHRPIAYNLVRAVLGAANGVPRGIDRIDFGYICDLFESWPADLFGVLPTPWGVRIFPRDRVLRARDTLARIWKERDPRGADPAMERLRAACIGQGAALPEPPGSRLPLPDVPGVLRALRLILGAGPGIGRPVEALPERTIHLDIGQRGLTAAAFAWAERRPDVSSVVMIHDVIPLQFPELVGRHRVTAHTAAMDVTARHAKAVLTSTAAAAVGIRAELALRGRADLPVHALGLPIDDLFRHPAEPDPVVAARPYFVACGAIEPRKNHLLLVEVWTRLVAARGAAAPRLVIAGSTGNAIFATLRARIVERNLAGHIVVVSGLSSPSIARTMAGARAVLAASFAEGYGLPPAEAATMGVPVVASDIPAHRDALGEAALFAAVDDVDGWVRAIEGLTDETPLRTDALRRVATHRSLDWPTYMAAVREVLTRIG